MISTLISCYFLHIEYLSGRSVYCYHCCAHNFDVLIAVVNVDIVVVFLLVSTPVSSRSDPNIQIRSQSLEL